MAEHCPLASASELQDNAGVPKELVNRLMRAVLRIQQYACRVVEEAFCDDLFPFLLHHHFDDMPAMQ